MNKEEKITISVNEEDVQNIINAYEKDIEYINQLEKENQRLKEIEKEHKKINGELMVENKELKEQLEVGEEQYNNLVEEKEELQEQLSIKTLQLEEIKLSKRDYTQENILEMKLTLKENQQKEFIEFLEKMWKETQDIWYIKILQKYKEIIGGK